MKKTTINLKYILQEPTSLWQKFHAKTKWKKAGKFLDVKDWPKAWLTTYFKEYPRLDKIILPPPSYFTFPSLYEAMMLRHSTRNFGKKPLTIDKISTLLYYAAGLRVNKFPWVGNRTYPSPGGRYTLELYMVSQNSDIPKGLYHYNLRQHSLEILDQFEHFDIHRYFNQDWIADAGCIFFFTGTFARNTIKYGERGYRHVLQEAGHVGQNFYLTASALDISICAVGGYVEPEIDKFLDVDSQQETVIYVLTIGSNP